jgi:hypothetical protein
VNPSVYKHKAEVIANVFELDIETPFFYTNEGVLFLFYGHRHFFIFTGSQSGYTRLLMVGFGVHSSNPENLEVQEAAFGYCHREQREFLSFLAC